MKRIETAVYKETTYIGAWTLILGVLMHAVFLMLGRWDLTVLWGSLLGCFGAVLNFFLMGLGVQLAVAKEEEKESKKVIQISHTLRFLLLVIFAAVGVAVPIFHSVAAVVPLLFPRIGIMFRPHFGGMDKEGGA